MQGTINTPAFMPIVSSVGQVVVKWSALSNRYLSNDKGTLAEIFDRMRPVPDPVIVTAGPRAKPGGDTPWEGADPITGRRYIARKQRGTDAVVLQEIYME